MKYGWYAARILTKKYYQMSPENELLEWFYTHDNEWQNSYLCYYDEEEESLIDFLKQQFPNKWEEMQKEDYW